MERHVAVPAGSLFVVDEGSGPPIVLVHASIANHRAWDALVPLLIGWLGDQCGSLRLGMLLLYATFGIVLSVALWARPLVTNAVIGAAPESVTG